MTVLKVLSRNLRPGFGFTLLHCRVNCLYGKNVLHESPAIDLVDAGYVLIDKGPVSANGGASRAQRPCLVWRVILAWSGAGRLPTRGMATDLRPAGRPPSHPHKPAFAAIWKLRLLMTLSSLSRMSFKLHVLLQLQKVEHDFHEDNLEDDPSLHWNVPQVAF